MTSRQTPTLCGVDGCTKTWAFSPNRHLIEVHGFCRQCVKRPAVPGETYCQQCLDWIADKPRREREYERQRRAEHERRERKRQWEAILEGHERMSDWTLETFPADDVVSRAALKAVNPWLWVHTDHYLRDGQLVEDDHEDIREFDGIEYGHDEDHALGLYIYGGVGSGKTGLVWSLLRVRVLIRRYDWEPSAAQYPAFANVVELLDRAKAAMRKGDGGAPIRKLYESSLLVLDDLGAERPTDWTRDAIHALVQQRHASELPTIVTSNYAPSQLARRLGKDDLMIGKRIVSRLVENGIKVKLDRPDLRVSPQLTLLDNADERSAGRSTP